MTEVLAGTARRLLARAATAQREARLPSLVAGVVRDGALAWSAGRGRVDGAPPTPDTQYRIGSISKTFTALLVMRLRDEGVLKLTDPLDAHVPGSPYGDRTIGQLLAHAAGVQAETNGEWWERTPVGGFGEVVPGTAALLAPGRRFHYSNLGYGVLGEVVARARGRSWFEALEAEVLAPLGMSRTTYRPVGPHATGYAVHPWAEAVLEEPEEDAGMLAAAGQLWSTLTDMGRLAAFLLGDTGDVLSADTLEEMGQASLLDESPDGWVSYGLGLQVFAAGPHRLIGHTGAMPGFVAGVIVDANAGVGSVWSANTTYGGDRGLSTDLLSIMRECEPPVGDEWEPSPLPPGIELSDLGTYYWGPNAYALRALAGELLGLDLVARRGRGSRFRLVDGEWIGLDGYFAGERLEVFSDHLELASYVFTRAPYGDGPIPGGVDPAGWQP